PLARRGSGRTPYGNRITTLPGSLGARGPLTAPTDALCVDSRPMSTLDSDSRLLEALIAAALEAGRAIHDIYASGFEVSHKADATPVTDADRAAETIIFEHLKRAAPGVPVVAEEEVAAGRTPAVGEEFFLVDPLDG